MFVIVGLGNVGKEYENTYHNMGFMAIDSVAEELGTEFTKTKYSGVVAETMVEGEKVILLKPTTYMNLSGESVSSIVRGLKLPLSNLLVIYDDIDLPVGTLRLRQKGSAGTHNGMRSIVERLGTTEFARLRIGIGKDERMELCDYVLSKVKGDNLDMIEKEQDKIIFIVREFVKNKGNVERIKF